MEKVIFLSFVTASVSFTFTKTKIFLPLRKWIEKKNSFLGELLCCGYCFGHWIAFILVFIYKPRLFESWWLLDYFLTSIIIAWLGGIQWILICWLMAKVENWILSFLWVSCSTFEALTLWTIPRMGLFPHRCQSVPEFLPRDSERIVVQCHFDENFAKSVMKQSGQHC